MAHPKRFMQYDQRKSQKHHSALTVVSVVVGLLFLIVLLWYQATNTIPRITIPSPPMPLRNAHDAYVAAGNAVIDSSKIGYAIGTKHSGQGDDRDYTPAEQEALLAENAAVLKRLRASFADPYVAPPARSFFALFPYYAKFRGMARLLQLEQQVNTARGDWNAAVNSGLDAMYMGAQMEHGSVIIGCLVGIACQAIGRRHLWDEVDHLNAKQTRHASARLEQIMAMQTPFANTLQEEEWEGQAGLMEIMRKPGWQNGLNRAMGFTPDGDEAGHSFPGFAELMQNVKLRLSGPRGVLLNYTGYMDAQRRRARPRYGLRGPEPPVPDDPINQMLSPVFAQVDCKVAASEAENALLLVTLALHAYQLQHHSYPLTLAELSPTYLHTIPQDPFGPTGSLHYKLDGAQYLLYSDGPDNKDDGGQRIDDPQRVLNGGSEYTRYLVQSDSKGDIVAGINR